MSIYEKLSDSEIIRAAYNPPGSPAVAANVEMMRRLKDSLIAQQNSANELTERIRKLNA
ncbi:hypothetical protein HYW67_01555 [Candidatus Parcubacteria bacterium]|nr:hypothetical protein [Candidatus Parcubacteria bacterium]